MRWPWHRPGAVSCGQCGAEAPAEARWCGTCGAALVDASRRASDDELEEAAGRGDGRAARLTAAALVVVVLGGLLVAQAASDPPTVPAGFMSRGDGARSGVVSRVDVPPPAGVAWRAPVEVPPLLTTGADVLGATEAAERELVVVHDPAAAGQRITAHDASTGEVVATTMLPLGSQPYDLSLADGLLAHRDLTSVTLVDVATGEHLWRIDQRLRDTQVTAAGVVGVPADGPGLSVLLLSSQDGSTLWRTDLTAGGRVTAAFALGGRVVVSVDGDDGGLVAGLDPATGDVVWRRDFTTGLPVRGTTFPLAAPSADDQRLLVVGRDRTVLLDGADGAMTEVLPAGLPTSESGAAAAFAPVLADLGDGLVVLSDGGRQIVAFDVTGDEPRPRWTVPAPGAPVLSLAVADDVVAVRGDAATTLLDASTGNPVAGVGPAGGPARLVVTSDGAVARVADEATVQLTDRDGVLWRMPTVAVHLPDLATDEGTVGVTTPDGVEVWEVEDGLRRFAHEAFDPALVGPASLTPPVLLAGKVVIAPPESQPPARGGLLALFADTGIVDWARTDDRVVPRGVPALDRDIVLVPVGSQLLGFDRATGRRSLVVETTIARADLAAFGGWLVATDAPRDAGDLWVGRRSTRELVFRAPIRTCAPPVIHEDLVIVVDHLGDIIARELESGDQPWGEKAGGSACRPLSIAEEVLVALVGDRELLAVTLVDGETAWRIELPDVAAGAPVVAGDQVLVPTLAGEVLAYDVRGVEAPDGPAWRVAVGGVPAGAVAVDGDTVLVVTRAGELVALR